MNILRLALLAALAALLGACSNPEATADRAAQALRTFRADPTEANQSAASAALARLESEIASLRAHAPEARVRSLDQRLAELRAEFVAAKIGRAMKDATQAIQGFGEVLKDAGQRGGEGD